MSLYDYLNISDACKSLAEISDTLRKGLTLYAQRSPGQPLPAARREEDHGPYDCKGCWCNSCSVSECCPVLSENPCEDCQKYGRYSIDRPPCACYAERTD